MEGSKTVDGAVLALRALSLGGAVTATELADRAGVNRTALYRLLVSLSAGHLVRRGADGRWRLGVGLLELAAQVERDLRLAARPLLEELAEEFGETSVISVPDGRDVVALDQAVGERHPVRVDYRPGFRHSQHLAAHGRALLAYAPEEVVACVVDELDDPDGLRDALARIRDVGHATTHDELQLGASGSAVPVFAAGVVVASLGVIAPTGRLPSEERLVASLRDAAARLGALLTAQARAAPASSPPA